MKVLNRPRGLLQPTQKTIIDWSNPLSRGLQFFPIFSGGIPVCAVTGYAPSAIGSGLKFGPQGGSFAAGTSNNGWLEWSQSWVSQAFSSKTEITTAVMIRATGSNVQSNPFSIANSTNTEYAGVLGARAPFGWYPKTGVSVAMTGSFSSYQTGLTYFWIGTGNADACRATLWTNGAMVADSGATAGLGTLNSALVRIRVGDERGSITGANATGSFSPLGEVLYAAAWNRSVSLSEMAQLAINPYSVVAYKDLQSMQFNPIRQFRGWGIPVN